MITLLISLKIIIMPFYTERERSGDYNYCYICKQNITK